MGKLAVRSEKTRKGLRPAQIGDVRSAALFPADIFQKLFSKNFRTKKDATYSVLRPSVDYCAAAMGVGERDDLVIAVALVWWWGSAPYAERPVVGGRCPLWP